MKITTTEAWLKVQIELDGVPVGIVTTDDLAFHPYPIAKALNAEEKSLCEDYLRKRFHVDVRFYP